MNIISRAEAKAAGRKRYFTGKPCLHGHTVERQTTNGICIECRGIKLAASQKANPDTWLEYSKKWRDENRATMNQRAVNKRRALGDVGRAASRRYAQKARAKDPEKYRDYNRNHYEKNKKEINARDRERRKSDPIWAFNQRARGLVRGALRRGGFKKNSSTERLLGCSFDEFRRQIERQFLPGMGWHNMHLWDIDHIVPSGTAKTQNDAEALNRAGNLRPLWREENNAKRAKQTHLL